MENTQITDHPAPPAWQIALIGLGLLAAQFAWVVYNTYVPLFLQAGSPQFNAAAHSLTLPGGFGLNAAQTGLMMALDNLAAFLLQPLSGMLSDRRRTRWGRRMPFLLLGMPAAALGLALIPLFVDAQQLAVFMVCLLLMVAAMACWRAPLFALMADLTPSAQRSRANGILNLMAGLGGILAFAVGSLLYALYRPLPFWAAALLLLAACALIFGRVREPQGDGHLSAESNWPGDLRAWAASLTPDRRRSLALLAAAVFFYMLGFHPIEAFFSSYGVSRLGLSEANSGLVLSAAYIAFILFAVPAGMLAGRWGRRRTVQVGLLLFAASLLVAYFTPLVWALAILMALGGLAWALIDINAYPMILDMAPARTSRMTGTASGIYFVATTLAAAIGPVVNGGLIDALGRNYGIIFLIGPVFFCISLLCINRVQCGHGEPVLS